jgi:hypothetical protein
LIPALVKAGANPNMRWGSLPPLQSAMATLDWTSVKALLELGADPKALNTFKEDAVAFYCESLSGLKRTAKNQGVVYEVGLMLKIPQLRPDCVADMERFR